MIEIEGFVIVPPLSKWDEKHKDEIIGLLAYSSFGKTPTEAWRRHIHPSQYQDDADLSIKIQRWHDMGYRVKTAKLVINND